MSDPRLLELLRRDRQAVAPGDARTRVAGRLAIGAPLTQPPTGHGGTPAASSVVTRGRTLAMLAAAFALGGTTGALLHARFAPASPARMVYVDRPASVVTSLPLPAAPPLPSAMPIATDAHAAAPASTQVGVQLARPSSSQLDAERSLLDVARAALVSGDTDAALGALERHERTYSHPLLAEEREALAIQTLVRAGRYEEARARAEAFRRRSPQSLLLPAVDSAIASIP